MGAGPWAHVSVVCASAQSDGCGARKFKRKACKALKAEGWLPVQPELAAGGAIPLVLAGVWWTTRRIHRRFFSEA